MGAGKEHGGWIVEGLESRRLLSGAVHAVINAGVLTITGGRAADLLVITGDAAHPGQLTIQGQGTRVNGEAEVTVAGVTGDIRIDLGGGANRLELRSVDAAGDLVVRTGNAPDQLYVRDVTVAGRLAISSAHGNDTVALIDSTVTGKTQVSLAHGDDILTADGSTFTGRFSLDTGKGDDSIALGDTDFIGGKTIDHGGGRDRTTQPISKTFDFNQGAQGWKANFADYHTGTGYEFQHGIRALPAELGAGQGYYIQSNNHSDDIFMYLWRQLGRGDGLKPNQSYQVRYTIQFASNAGSGSVGIGGSPGNSVYLKAGASERKPRPITDANGQVRLNVDHGQQSQGGTAVSLIGDIANGSEDANPPYISLERTHIHTAIVRTDSQGHLYLIIGTDSGFEGLTGLYFQKVQVTLTPVVRASEEHLPSAKP